MSHRQVLQDIHNGSRTMDNDECLCAQSVLARLHDEVEPLVENQDATRVERKPRKQRTCWTCGGYDHVAAKCPSRRFTREKQRDETNREGSRNTLA